MGVKAKVMVGLHVYNSNFNVSETSLSVTKLKNSRQN